MSPQKRERKKKEETGCTFLRTGRLLPRCAGRFVSHEEDSWDFGTVRNVQARPGGPATVRVPRQQQQDHARQPLQPQPHQQPTRGAPLPPGITSRDYAAPQPPPAQMDRPGAFETVRGGPVPSSVSSSSNGYGPTGISAHSEYDDYSSTGSSGDGGGGGGGTPVQIRDDAQARAAREALDRERARLEAMRLEDARRRASGEEEARRARLARERAEAMGTTSGSSDEHEDDAAEEEEDGGILGSVVLPVLDSVSSRFLGRLSRSTCNPRNSEPATRSMELIRSELPRRGRSTTASRVHKPATRSCASALRSVKSSVTFRV